MLEGLLEALQSPMARIPPRIHICLDSLGVALNTGCIPGCAGIEGNKLADKEAKKCAKLPPAPELNQSQSLSNAKRKVRKVGRNNWRLEWQRGNFSEAARTYAELGRKPTSRAISVP